MNNPVHGVDSADPFLGQVVEVAIVTRDHQRTMEGLWRMGIGPWRVYTFSPGNTSHQTYRGQASPFTLTVCFAQVGNMTWEIIEPVTGPTIFNEFLDRHGEGIHHVAFDCNNIPFAERLTGFAERGFQLVQSGCWLDQNQFAFFDTEPAMTTCLETIAFPNDWTYPEPVAWYPPQAKKN